MPLNTQSFNTIVQNEIAAAQASSSSLLDFSTGSVLLALMQANASAVALWLQGLDVYILSLARAATSNGTDLDSWMADFGFTRLPATQALGTVTFSRATTTAQAVVPVGAQVQTTNGAQTYTVILDTTNPNYNAGLNGYVITVSTSSINVTVQANNAGTQGNAIANSINVITTPIAYVDTVNNASAFTNALNSETDAAFRVRFVAYLASLSKATNAAISYAVSQVQGVVDFTITENQAYNGSTQYGYFFVVVDDGTGNPSGGLLANVNSAIEAVRGLTITYGVFAPVITNATVVMTVVAASGYTHSAVAAIVSAALTTYINTLTLGETLYYTRLAQVAYDSTPGVLNVTSVTLNSGTSDLTANAEHIIKVVSITIN
jgi:hypothetical protein